MSEPFFTTVIPAIGPDGNVFAVLGNATRLMREIGVDPAKIASLRERVMGSKSYAEALDHVRAWFPVDTGEDE